MQELIPYLKDIVSGMQFTKWAMILLASLSVINFIAGIYNRWKRKNRIEESIIFLIICSSPGIRSFEIHQELDNLKINIPIGRVYMIFLNLIDSGKIYQTGDKRYYA